MVVAGYVEIHFPFYPHRLRGYCLLFGLLLDYDLLLVWHVEVDVLFLFCFALQLFWFESREAVFMRLHHTLRASERWWVAPLVRLPCSHHPLHDQCRCVPSVPCVFGLEWHSHSRLWYLIEYALVSLLLSLFLFLPFLPLLKLSSLALLLFRVLFLLLIT